jgi:hypothetical protein
MLIFWLKFVLILYSFLGNLLTHNYPDNDLDSVWEKRAKRIEFFPKDPWCMNQEELEKHHPMSGAGCSVM